MNVTLRAIRLGLRRGGTETVHGIRSPSDQAFYLFIAVASVGYLVLRRDTEVAGTDLLLPSVAMPSILSALIAFGLVIGPASTLAMQREDGTLLRHKAVPHGLIGYVTGQLVVHSVQLLPLCVVVLVPSFLLFDGLMHNGLAGWASVVGYLVLGLLAMLPIGIILGSLMPSTQKVMSWGMLPIMVLGGISGIFFPIQSLWVWVQVIAQAFPMYWLGLGMRSAFLPEAAAVSELGESWRSLESVLVLGAWAVVGIAVTPLVLRRMARRTSGSQVAAAREQALQWLR